jgi:hypothetical protein
MHDNKGHAQAPRLCDRYPGKTCQQRFIMVSGPAWRLGFNGLGETKSVLAAIIPAKYVCNLVLYQMEWQWPKSEDRESQNLNTCFPCCREPLL